MKPCSLNLIVGFTEHSQNKEEEVNNVNVKLLGSEQVVFFSYSVFPFSYDQLCVIEEVLQRKQGGDTSGHALTAEVLELTYIADQIDYFFKFSQG